ncbi:right-handed parallel beta-helix repeat-containing protein [Plantactinospora sp. GCM10030261]|uniref:right-handed parallel beta-helix repeat-containing protein n=1 Tax=Plantactinospora sp. GCM10030261 TaxID=3273420 RepID=UPI0036173BA2
MMRTAMSLVLAATMAVAGAPVPAVAAGPPVRCGDTITESVTLSANLRCAGDALIVGASGVTIDLNGYAIVGDPGGRAITVAGDQTLSGVTVRDGTVRGFPGGILLQDVATIALTGVRLVDTNLEATQFSGVSISDSALTRSGVGTSYGQGLTLTEVRMTGGYLSAISVQGVSTVNSVLVGSRIGGVEFYSFELARSRLTDTAIDVTEAGDYTIHDNVFSGAGVYGLLADGLRIENNLFRDMRVGVRLESDGRGLLVRDNRFVNTGVGVRVSTFYLAQVADLTITDNEFVRNGSAGVFIEAADPLAGPDDEFVISGNVFRHNGYAGTEVDGDGRRIDDGLHLSVPVDSPLVVAGNQTYHNADHGIEALPVGSVRDGGGNVSRGDPNGCAGVVCAYR